MQFELERIDSGGLVGADPVDANFLRLTAATATITLAQMKRKYVRCPLVLLSRRSDDDNRNGTTPGFISADNALPNWDGVKHVYRYRLPDISGVEVRLKAMRVHAGRWGYLAGDSVTFEVWGAAKPDFTGSVQLATRTLAAINRDPVQAWWLVQDIGLQLLPQVRYLEVRVAVPGKTTILAHVDGEAELSYLLQA